MELDPDFMVEIFWLILFFGGFLGVVRLVTRHFLRELRSSVKEWSKRKSVVFSYKMLNATLFSLSVLERIWGSTKNRSVEREWLKKRLAAPDEEVSDEEADLFLEYNVRRKRWVVAFGFLYVVLFGFATAIAKAIKPGAY